jgi:hypothetical protein
MDGQGKEEDKITHTNILSLDINLQSGIEEPSQV